MGRKKEIVAMLLAGGQGTRLQVLTKDMAKPAVPFGGKYRIIDFPLSNCANSGISTVGVLTQFMPLELNSYMGNGSPWDLDRMDGGLSILPPYTAGKTGEWYKGTANAIYQNIKYIEQYDPEYVLILSGDHIYKMNYKEMLNFHKEKGADLTIAHINVPIEEASRFGILNTDDNLKVTEFLEKPENPISTKASMGIYIFSWKQLKEYLIRDEENELSEKDFGKNIIPMLLEENRRIFAFPFAGYWKDVGTIESLWEANMDLIKRRDEFNISDKTWKVYYRHEGKLPQFIGDSAQVTDSMISDGTIVLGTVHESIVSSGVSIEKNAKVQGSIIMQNAVIEEGATVINSIIAEGTVVKSGVTVGHSEVELGQDMITVIGKDEIVTEDTKVGGN